MNWQQYSRRRGGMSLEDFLLGCSSLNEALEIFSSRDIEPPLEQLKAFFEPKIVELKTVNSAVDVVSSEETSISNDVSEQKVVVTSPKKLKA